MRSLVVDASAVVELLRGDEDALAVLGGAMSDRRSLLAPELLDVEVAHVFRRFDLAGTLDPGIATELVDDLLALPIRRIGHRPLLRRAFQFRRNVTAYDGLYIALAEAVEGTLVTFDAGLAATARGHVETQLLTGG